MLTDWVLRRCRLSAAMPHGGRLGPPLGYSVGTNFQKGISLSLFVKIAHMIRRWKAILMILNLIYNILCKASRNIHVNLPQSSVSFLLNSYWSVFPCFCCIYSHCSQLTNILKKELIKKKTIVFWHKLWGTIICLKISKITIHHSPFLEHAAKICESEALRD